MPNFKQICNLANRIELAAQFATSTNDPDAMARTIAEAFTAAFEVLDITDPVWLREAYARAVEVFQSQQAELKEPETKQKFIANFGDLMQEVGVQQKAIARLGTAAFRWNIQPTPYDQLANALDTTGSVVAQSPAQLMRLSHNDKQEHGMFLVSDVFYGLTLVIAALRPDQAENRWHPAIVNASANIAVQAAQTLEQRGETTT